MNYLLSYIYWKLDSPFGEFLTNDFIQVDWNTSTNAIEVFINNSGPSVTVHNDIPQQFTYNSKSANQYKEESVIQNTICEGTSLVTFNRISSYPYFQKVLLQDHPSCGFSEDVCDLSFDALVAVVNASDESALDGEITVSSTSTHGPVKYRINSTFEYNDGTGQTSGTFTSIGKGNYLVYARDALNCLQVKSITVGVTKVYNSLYILEFYDEQIGYHHKTEILEKNYSGSAIEVKGGDVPTLLSLRGEGYKDKFTPILSTEIIFTMISESESSFVGLYTNDPEKYRLRHSIDSGSGYEVVWIGKVLPNQYEENFLAVPYEVSVVATDGLQLLNTEYLVDDDDNRLFGEVKIISLIAWILDKIGLGINIRSACNLYAEPMDSTDSDDPLDQAYVDVSRYYLITDVPTCLDVLKYLLEPFGAQIILYNNVWNIIRTEERANAFDYREYDSNGDYVRNGSYDPVRDLTSPNSTSRMAFMSKNQVLNISPGYGTLRLIYNLGLKDGLLVNGDFSVKKYSTYQANVSGNIELVAGTIPDLTGMQIIANGTSIQTAIEDLGEGNVAIRFTNVEKGGYLQSITQTLKLGNSEGLRLTVKAKLFTTITTDNFPSDFFYYLKLRVDVIYGDYFLTPYGWEDILYRNDNPFIVYVSANDQNRFIDVNIETEQGGAFSLPPEYVDGEDFSVRVWFCNAIDYDYTSFPSLESETVGQFGRFKENQKKEVFIAPGLLHYYELQNNTEANSTDPYLTPDIIRPTNYDEEFNPYQWVRVAHVVAANIITTTSIDKVQVEVTTNKKRLPETANYKKPMENRNTLNLDKIIYHGSLVKNGSTTYQPGLFPSDFLSGVQRDDPTEFFNKYYLNSLVGQVFFTANSAEIVYSGYLRDSLGVGYEKWSRDSVSENAPLEDIYQAMYAAQYNKPWQIISGDIIGDILFTPIDIINVSVNGKKYFPVAMEIDYRRNQYKSTQFLELTDVSISAGDGNDAAFTTGFSLGFKS